MNKIVEWETIQDQFCHGLLLGNGASKAVHAGFGYKSIFDEAKSRNYITKKVSEIFDGFGVQDFELVLRRLGQAKLVNKALKIHSKQPGKIDNAYKEIQKALISTIIAIHPSYEKVKPHLNPIYQFMQKFETVVSLNYDLIVYWAILESRTYIRNWFKDCFNSGVFSEDIKALRTPYDASGSTLLFYPHGNLVLTRTEDGKEEKIKAAESANLLKTILKKWENENVSPLFVCEGATEHKKLAIESASYFQRVYHEILPSLGESLVIYGWSMPEQDQHILNQLKEKNLERVAVSIHENNLSFANLAYGVCQQSCR